MMHARRELAFGLLFASPWSFGFLAFTLYPMAASLYYSFTSYASSE
jgi:multiple sugar transport system permease protein